MRSNKTPFTDVCELIKITRTPDGSGFVTVDEESREIFCSVSVGVVRSEFWESAKAGVKLSVTIEIWEDDYGGEEIVGYEGGRYKIERAYPTGHGTLELACSEVVR